MVCLLGIDNGLTVTKAVVFDEAGKPLSIARRRINQIIDRPRHVERDMRELWRETAAAIREAIATSGRTAGEIAAVAATAHGDGLYLLDSARQPLGNGILSLDSRACGIVRDWERQGLSEIALRLSGQMPHASAPASLLAWVKRHEPERYTAIGHVVACKDWLRYCLTGTIGTDLTEASTSFSNVETQTYDAQILELFGLGALQHALPPVQNPDDVAGTVTAEAAAATGLMRGTPVVAGIHDVTASALGIGGLAEGIVAIVAGTYSINETLTSRPKIGSEWFCRNGLRRGEWNNMAISPASATNYDWFIDQLCATDRAAAERDGQSFHAVLAREIERAFSSSSSLMYHPYLFGSPHGAAASASFLGLRGWHGRGDMLRAVLEGIAFNHRLHVDALRDNFPITAARLTGGISRNPLFAQLMADVLGLPVTTTDTEEAAAWGAALCAGAGVSMFASPYHDPRFGEMHDRIFAPTDATATELAERYRLHCKASRTLGSLWTELEDLASKDTP